ncbi:HAD-IB family phosphatase [Akkermansiaceae bacterium]|nr:HAD-IB family phosphatase [Akkermansiaceae bacterium]
MKLIVFDCDSTLSSIEGIDELGRLAGEDTFLKVEALTNAAMNGEVPIDEVFAKRLAIISPSTEDVKVVAQQYIDTVEPTALETLEKLKSAGWTPMILSGGFKVIIEPLAEYLGIERVEAVPLSFKHDGSYDNFDSSYPTTYNGGKPEIIEMLKKEFSPEKIVMVGDGVSDLETQNNVDSFIGYGGYTPRERVKKEAAYFITQLDEILDILEL